MNNNKNRPDIQLTQSILMGVLVVLASPLIMIAAAIVLPPAACAMLMARMVFPTKKSAFVLILIPYMILWVGTMSYWIISLYI